MIRLSWKMAIGLLLLLLSSLLGGLHYLAFRNLRDLLFYLALDIVFVPVQVLLVTLIIEKFLTERERQALLKKMNMVIGAFMGEFGAEFLRRVDGFCGEAPDLARRLAVTSSWGKKDYQAALRFAAQYQSNLDPSGEQLRELRDFLLARRPFLLALLQNPNLLEHDTFTDLLWAICHLTEELQCRSGIEKLPESDRRHLANDIRRANTILIREWLSYLRHLQAEYPYMFSLAVRMNPFNPEASPVVS
ncbi:MAG: hypothetical protein JXB25_09160 [Deltaproteobacteria bacterium]|nr:hypothetical protein [Deltaproteobacteria bacterium]